MKISFPELIVNELLAIVQNAIDIMDGVSVLKICKSTFKEGEVCSGKALLFQYVDMQMPSRQRDGTDKSVQDITLLKETHPGDVPTFMEKELHKLPPVLFDDIEISRLLKDISFLKMSLADVLRKLEDDEEEFE